MRQKLKDFFRIMIIAIIILILPTSFKLVNAAPARIETRGLIFNSGVSSDQIKLIKDFFRARQEYNVPWGYNYDYRTKELVRKYQRENGIPTTGIAAQMTLAQMNKDIIKYEMKIGPRQPETSIYGDMIIVNKSSNTLHHMRNGRVYKSYPIATGRLRHFTPERIDKIVTKQVNPIWYGFDENHTAIPGGSPNNPLGTRWLGISFGGGNLYGIHGNANPNSIGKYESSGCIRMFNSHVEGLYSEIGYGTPVWIGTEDVLMSYGVRFRDNIGTFPTNPKPPAKPKPQEELIKLDIDVELNGESLELEKEIWAKSGTTYYPFREIIEKVGGEVKWDPQINAAIAEFRGNRIEFEFNSNVYRVNGETKYLPAGQKTMVKDDSNTYIPIRFAMEGLGFEVDWDQDAFAILLSIEEVEEPFEKPEEPFEKPEEPFEKPEEPFEKPEEPFEKPEEPFEKPQEPFEKPEEPFEKLEEPFEKPEEPFEKLEELIEKHVNQLKN